MVKPWWELCIAASAPIRVTPEMAFDPDMSGVCKVDGTLEISSKPRKMARTKIKVKYTPIMVLSLFHNAFVHFTEKSAIVGDKGTFCNVVIQL